MISVFTFSVVNYLTSKISGKNSIICRKKMDEHFYKRPNRFECLESMRVRGDLCDVTIQVHFNVFFCNFSLRKFNEKYFYGLYFVQVHGKMFVAHKIILAATIPYFQKMFTNDFLEKNQKVVSISSITPE